MDQDMRPGEIVAVLEQLRFGAGLRTIKLDGPVRDYLVSALHRRG